VLYRPTLWFRYASWFQIVQKKHWFKRPLHYLVAPLDINGVEATLLWVEITGEAVIAVHALFSDTRTPSNLAAILGHCRFAFHFMASRQASSALLGRGASGGSRMSATVGVSPLRQAAGIVLPGTELERMRRTVLADKDILSLKSVDEEREVAARGARKALSDARAARFPNTLAALRKRKLHAREERLAKEEEERARLDDEEETLRQTERLRTLEAASNQIIENTDKMKMLRSQALGAYVRDTCEQQIALNKRKAALEKEEEEERHAALLETIAAGDARERVAIAGRAAKTASLAKDQRVQLAEVVGRRYTEQEETKQEGRRIAEAAKAAEIAEAREKDRRREAQRKANEDMLEVNRHLQSVKLESERKAAEDARQLEAYIAAKKVEAETKAALIEARRQEAIRKADYIAEKVCGFADDVL
jgi:hypothetical protein